MRLFSWLRMPPLRMKYRLEPLSCVTARSLGKGNNRVIRDSDPTAHAEIVAMRHAARHLGNYRLTGCTLYATLEPCAMCAGAILHARIQRLLYATPDPKAGACGSALSVMNHPVLNHTVDVETGVLREDSAAMLRRFFQERRSTAAQRL